MKIDIGKIIVAAIGCALIFFGLRQMNNILPSEAYTKGDTYRAKYIGTKAVKRNDKKYNHGLFKAVIDGKAVKITHHKEFDCLETLKLYFKKHKNFEVTKYIADSQYLYVFSDITIEEQIADSKFFPWSIIILGLIFSVVAIFFSLGK